MIIPLVLKILKEFWKQILAGSLILLSIVLMGFSLYSWGYNSSNEKWELAIKERDKVQAAQTLEIQKLSKQVSDSKDALLVNSDLQLNQILLSVKNKPLYKIDASGKCTPSIDFEKAYSDIIKGGK